MRAWLAAAAEGLLIYSDVESVERNATHAFQLRHYLYVGAKHRALAQYSVAVCSRSPVGTSEGDAV